MVSDPDLLGLRLLIIGRQEITEDNKDCSWVQSLELDDVAQTFAKYDQRNGNAEKSLLDAFAARFGKPLEALSPALPLMIIFAAVPWPNLAPSDRR